MTPLTELTALMREYAERHGILLKCLKIECTATLKGCVEQYNSDHWEVIWYFKNETDFLNKIKG